MIQVVRCLSRTLPVQQCLPGGNASAVRIRRRAVNLTAYDHQSAGHIPAPQDVDPECHGGEVVMEAGVLIAASFSTDIWHLFLTQAVFFGVGMGFLFAGSVGAISQWFAKRRSVATGTTATGSGIGGLAFSLLIHAIIAA